MSKDNIDRVYIPCGDGSGRRIQLYMACDGDIHVSIVQEGNRFSRDSVRVCTGQGNPPQREVNALLHSIFEAAEKKGWIE